MRYLSATIAPAANRPPPIGSEVVASEALGAERGRAGADGGLGVVRGVGPPVARGTGRGLSAISGASVSRFPSKSGSAPSVVALGSTSTALPHFEQKRAVSGNCWPQAIQNMGSRILPLSVDDSEHLRAACFGELNIFLGITKDFAPPGMRRSGSRHEFPGMGRRRRFSARTE